MKKKLAMLLATTMVLSLSVPAFAAETEDQNKATADKESNNSASINVNGTYLSEKKSDEIISVNVEWKDMRFTYAAARQGTWDPTDHTYSGDKTAGWNKTTSDITVTNHSNVAVTANLSYTQNVTSVTGDLSEETLDLESAAQDKYMGNNAEQAPSKTSTFTIDGTLESSSEKNLGTITVSVDKQKDTEDDEDANIDWKVVTDEEGLRDALDLGGDIKLNADITVEDGLGASHIDYLNLNLNGHTLTCSCLEVGYFNEDNGGCVISNGTIVCNQDPSSGGCSLRIVQIRATVKNCTLQGNEFYALQLMDADVTVKDSTLIGGVTLMNGEKTSTLQATDRVTVQKIEEAEDTGVCMEEGCTATFQSDPSDLLYYFYTLYGYDVSQNDNGTWTVTGISGK